MCWPGHLGFLGDDAPTKVVLEQFQGGSCRVRGLSILLEPLLLRVVYAPFLEGLPRALKDDNVALGVDCCCIFLATLKKEGADNALAAERTPRSHPR